MDESVVPRPGNNGESIRLQTRSGDVMHQPVIVVAGVWVMHATIGNTGLMAVTHTPTGLSARQLLSREAADDLIWELGKVCPYWQKDAKWQSEDIPSQAELWPTVGPILKRHDLLKTRAEAIDTLATLNRYIVGRRRRQDVTDANKICGIPIGDLSPAIRMAMEMLDDGDD